MPDDADSLAAAEPLLGNGAVCVTGAHGSGKTTLASHIGWDMFAQGHCPGNLNNP